MRVRMRGTHFGALHEQRVVGLLLDVARLERPREAGPTGPRIVLVERAEQRLSGHDVHVDPVLMIVPKIVLEGALGGFVLRDFVLQWRQRPPEIGVVWLWLHGIHRVHHLDRKSTRLNSSHSQISYAVFCLKKKKKISRRSNLLRN